MSDEMDQRKMLEEALEEIWAEDRAWLSRDQAEKDAQFTRDQAEYAASLKTEAEHKAWLAERERIKHLATLAIQNYYKTIPTEFQFIPPGLEWWAVGPKKAVPIAAYTVPGHTDRLFLGWDDEDGIVFIGGTI